MKKIIWLAIFTLSVILSYGQNFSMQSTNSGISLKASAGAGGWKSNEFLVNSKLSASYNLEIGYGFNENLEVFGAASVLRVTKVDFFELPYSVQQFDLGARYTFGSTLNPVRFYAGASLSVISSDQSIEEDDWFFGEFVGTYELRGIGGTLSVGGKYHLSLPVALTFESSLSFGNLNNNRYDGEAIPEFDFTSYKFKVGAVIYFNQL